MNPLAIGSLSGAVVALLVAGFVLSKDTKSPANRAFAIAALTAAYHSLTEFGLRQSETMATAEFWLKVLSGLPVLFVVLLHFVLTITGVKGRLVRLTLYTFAIVPALVLVSVTATTNLFITGAVEKYWGWTFVVNTESWPLILGLAWLPPMIILSIVLPVRHYLRTQYHRERQQVKFLIIAISAPLIVWGVSELVLPWFDVHVPNFASPTYALGLALIGYAIWRHQLFALTPAAAAEEIIAAMSDILLLLNSQGVITAANRTALDIAGYDRNELVGASADLIFPDAEYRTALSRNTQPSGSYDNGVHTGIEVLLAKRSGERVPVLLSMSVMRERDGEPLGVVCIGMDLTERKQADAARRALEVRALSQSKLATIGEVATGVAHEINQPLTYISTMLQATQKDIELNDLDDTALRERLAESYRQVGRITTIVDHLRAFGRSDDLSKEPVDLDKVLDNALLLLGGRLTQLGITVVRESEEALPPVRGSANQLEQVLINLFQNAIDALSGRDGDGRINVTMSESRSRDHVTIAFADNGVGIAPEDLDQVFVPFFSTKEVGKGTGLGLSIALDSQRPWGHDNVRVGTGNGYGPGYNPAGGPGDDSGLNAGVRQSSRRKSTGSGVCSDDSRFDSLVMPSARVWSSIMTSRYAPATPERLFMWSWKSLLSAVISFSRWSSLAVRSLTASSRWLVNCCSSRAFLTTPLTSNRLNGFLQEIPHAGVVTCPEIELVPMTRQYDHGIWIRRLEIDLI